MPCKAIQLMGHTWYIIEYNPEEKLAFGYADLNMGFPELG